MCVEQGVALDGQLRVPVDVEHQRRRRSDDHPASRSPCRGWCARRPGRRPGRSGARRRRARPGRRAAGPAAAGPAGSRRRTGSPGRRPWCWSCSSKVPDVSSRCPSRRCSGSRRAARAGRGRRRSRAGSRHLIRFSMPAALFRAFLRMNSPSVIESHSAAFGCAQGASTGISAANLLSLLQQQRRRRAGSSGPAGRCRCTPSGPGLGDVDVLAGDVLRERRAPSAPWPAPGCGPGSDRRTRRRPRSRRRRRACG